MPALRYYNKTTGEWLLFGNLDGVDTSGMGNATAIPPPGSVGSPVDVEVQYGDKAIPLSGAVFSVGGPPGGGVQVLPPVSVTATVNQQSGTVTVTMTPDPSQATTENLLGVVGRSLMSVAGLSRTITLPADSTYQPAAQAGINGVFSTLVLGTPVYLPVPMAVTGLPVISGTPDVGNDIAVTAAPVVGGAVSAIQWRRNGLPIAGAITAVYRLVTGDANAQISADVTYTNTSGQFTEVKQASPVGPVFDPTPVPEPTWTTMPQAAAAMGYGINATGLEFIPAWTNGAAKLTNQVIGLYKSSGLGHIRLPVRSEMYAANTTASTISQALWDEIDPIVDECIRIGMYLVIGYDHHNRNMMGDALSGATAVPDAEIETRAANRAAQFATRYGNRSKWIHISPSNEPHGRMTGARWNKAYRQQLAAIRSIDADIPVWVNPVAFGNAWALGELDLASDAWLGIDTHVYLDIDYTHQGGFGYEASAGLVPFRASYMAQVLTAAKVMQRYSAAHASVPMWAGEYGATAYAPKREVNIRGTRQILDAAGFKSAIWSSTPPDFGVARLTGGQTTVTQSECICVVEYIGPVGGFVTVSSTGGDYNIGPETLTSSNAFTELLWRSAGKPDAVFTVSGLSGSSVQAKVHVLPFASANWSVTQTAEVVKADAPTHIDLVLPTFSFLPEMREAMLGLPAGAGVEAVPATPASIINIGASPTRLSFSSNVGTWNATTQMMEFTAGGPTALEYIVVAPSTPLVAGEDYQVSFINEGTGCASVAICDTQSATPYSTVPSGADTGLAPWDATTPVKTLTAASLPPNAGFVIAFQQRRKYTPASYETEVSVAVKPSIGYTLKIESCGAGFTGAAKIRGGSTLATWGVADVGTTKTVAIPSGEYELVLARTSSNANEESRVDVYPTSGTETTAIGVHICTVEDSGGSQVVAPGAISNLRFGTTSLDGVPIAWDAASGATSYDVKYVSASGTVTVNTTSTNILLTDIGGVTSFGVEVTPKNTVAGPSSSMPFTYYTALTWAVGYTGGTTVIALEPIVRTRGGVEFTANPGAGTITVNDNTGATFSTRGPGSATSSVAVTTQRLLILSSAGGSCSTQVNAFWASKLTAGSAAGSMVSGANVTITPPTFSNLTEFSLRYGLNYYDAATGTHDDALPTDAVSSTVIAIPASKVGKYIKSAEYFIFGSDYPNFAVQAGRISLNGISVDALPGAGPVAAPATQASLTNSTAATGVPVALASVSGAVLVNGLSITVAAGSDSGTGMVAVFARTSGGAEVYLTSFGAASAGDVFQTGPLPDDTASVIFKPAGATGSTYSYTLTVTAA